MGRPGTEGKCKAAGKGVREHPEQGETAFVLAGLFAAMCLALYAYQTFGERVPRNSPPTT